MARPQAVTDEVIRFTRTAAFAGAPLHRESGPKAFPIAFPLDASLGLRRSGKVVAQRPDEVIRLTHPAAS